MRIISHIISELHSVIKDEGVLLFFIFLPIAYPLIYSWIYNNEVVREVPVVVVDDSHSSASREFCRMFEASPDVTIAYRCKNIGEGQRVIAKGDAYGILYFPADFDKRIGRMEQATVSVYCDMSYMLTYKAIFQTATAISMQMGTEIQRHRLGNTTVREDEISTSPLTFDEVPMFNTTAGYGNFILPAVLVLIIQQALLLGVGMINGTDRENRFSRYRRGKSDGSSLSFAITLLVAKTIAYMLIFSVMLAWITIVVPHIFGFVSMVHGWDLFRFMMPYLLSCIFLSITASALIRYRESVMLVVVFSSLILLFMSGVTWPMSSISGVWQGISQIFPSTFGIRGFVRMNSMGARLPEVAAEYHALWVQTVVYAFAALYVLWRRVRFAEQE